MAIWAPPGVQFSICRRRLDACKSKLPVRGGRRKFRGCRRKFRVCRRTNHYYYIPGMRPRVLQRHHLLLPHEPLLLGRRSCERSRAIPKDLLIWLCIALGAVLAGETYTFTAATRITTTNSWKCCLCAGFGTGSGCLQGRYHSWVGWVLCVPAHGRAPDPAHSDTC